jgi:hypothetical protein
MDYLTFTYLPNVFIILYYDPNVTIFNVRALAISISTILKCNYH